MNSFKYIKDTFLRLTSKTYPYGCEDDLFREMTQTGLFPDLKQDQWGNYFIGIGSSRTVFTSHFDTACRDQDSVKHIVNKQQIVSTDGTTILGADDKAGVTLMLWMIKNNVPGLYYFFIGEEVGCIGSGAASTYGEFIGKYDRMISFDRRGTNSVITHQSSVRCCSDDFATQLAKQLNKTPNMFYKLDDCGIYTDSAEFVSLIPECTNISVGYYNEHTYKETQDLWHLNKLANALLSVKWEELIVSRDPSKKESKWDSYPSIKYNPSNLGDYSDWSDVYEDEIASYQHCSIKRNKKNNRSRYKKSQKSQTYWDIGYGNLEPMDYDSNGKGIYDTIKDKYLASDITREELNIVRDQYLDMDNTNDRKSYQVLDKVL